MPFSIFLIVLGGAFMHATWNTLIKSAPDKNLETALANFFTSLVALPFLLIYGLPDLDTFPYIILSLILHVIYFYMVASAYRHGDLNLAYPIMRGVAPMLVLIFGAIIFTDSVSLLAVVGILGVCLGVILLGLRKSLTSLNHKAALLFALANAVVIALYTIIDGKGARIASNVWSYVSLLMFLNGYVFPAILIWQRRSAAELKNSIRYIQKRWLFALASGALIMGSYSFALYAMTQAPVALVAALREVSVLITFLFGVFFLKEKLYPQRFIGAFLILLGMVLIKFD